MKFVNLYLQTEYTLLASVLRIEETVRKAAESGFRALAVADRNNMHGAIKFRNACLKYKIKPIFGLQLELESEYDDANTVLLYARNNDGYRNLLRIVTMKNTGSKKVKIEDILPYLINITVIIPGNEHEMIKAYLEGNFIVFQEVLKKYLPLSRGENSALYFGIGMQTKEERQKAGDLIFLGKQHGIASVAVHKSCYPESEDCEIYRILRSVALGITDYKCSERERNAAFITTDEAADLFRKYPELIMETEKIADDCNVTLEFGKYHLPIYTVDGEKVDAGAYLHDLAIVGLKKRLDIGKNKVKDYSRYLNRLRYELSVISKMGFEDYFLIVYDFIRYAKSCNILVGPGRGSGPGSLVAYALGITEIDPLAFNLIFERFLNPERVSMPDIDTDFPDDRREEVIKYMGRRYGKKRVAHICTFGTYGPRMAVRDVAKVIGLKPLYLETVLAQLPPAGGTLSELTDVHSRFYPVIQSNGEIAHTLETAAKIQNLPRNLSVHAAGIIMADGDLDSYTPLADGINGLYQTQFEASDLEQLGLVKIDFLGIRNLTIITEVLKLMNVPDRSLSGIYRIPLDDQDTYRLLASGHTDGIFQLESGGMRKTLMRLQTDCFEDIVNAIALYRPGPMEMLPSFIRRKTGREKVTYPHPDLEPILSETYGIIVYQEQIMRIAAVFAGYSLGEADLLRRAVSKKKADLLASHHDKFIDGALKKGYEYKVAANIFALILKFADYGFNKNHSVAYAYVSYQMAYLKTHHFSEFMAVSMSHNIGRFAVLRNCIRECQNRGVKILLPSVNQSGIEFTVSEGEIRYSLLGINGLGEVSVRQLTEERQANGPYPDYDAFIARTKSFLSRKAVETLIYAGALDEFGLTRKTMIGEYGKSSDLAAYGALFKGELVNRRFGDEEFGFNEISALERQALGFNLKYDLFKRYENLKKKYNTIELGKLPIGRSVRLLFLLEQIKVIRTKKGEEMAFCVIADDTGNVDGVLFPRVYGEYKKILAPGKIYLGEMNSEKRQGKLQLIVNKLFSLPEQRE